MVRLRRLVRRSLALQTAYRVLVRSRWSREGPGLERGVSRRTWTGRGCSAGAAWGRAGRGRDRARRLGQAVDRADLRRWFSPKFDTMAVYFGSGDGPSSLLRWPMKALRDRVPDDRGRTTAPGEPRGGRRSGWAKALWALAPARESDDGCSGRSTRHRGMLVICDRYPQAQRPGINDGRCMHRWSGDGARGRIACWEAGPTSWPNGSRRIWSSASRSTSGPPSCAGPSTIPTTWRSAGAVAGLASPKRATARWRSMPARPYGQVLEAVKAAVWRCL